MNVGVLTCRVVLAAVFAIAGVAKLADLAGSRDAMRSFGVPARLAAPVGLLLPVLELTVAATLLPAASAWAGAVAALTLLLAFAVAIALALARGRQPDCHCFGQLHSSRAGAGTLARDLGLAGVAAFVVIGGRVHPGPSAIAWIGHLSAGAALGLAGGCVLAAVLTFQAWFSWQLLRQNGRLLERLGTIEQRLAGSADRVGAPSAANGNGRAPGLAVGSPAPGFSLPSLDGSIQSLDQLRSAGKPVILIFSDPGCGPCAALLPELATWQGIHASRLTFALISRGELGVNRARAAEHGLARVLLQKDREVAESYLALGTPSAVLVSVAGQIASPLAGGAEPIRRLVTEAATAPGIVVQPVAANGNGHPPRAATPPSAVPVGEPAPAFELPDLAGKVVGLSAYRGRRVVVAFWNPGCGFCQRMLPELKAWEADRPAAAAELVLVSTGDREANQAMGLDSTVLLDHASATMRAFGAGGTPMAVVVDEAGRIASPLLVGADAVLGVLRPEPVPAVS